jgi:ATP-dependent Zn protease
MMSSKLLKTNEDEKTAYHEAGHVVAAFEMGFSVRYVTIRPHGKEILGNTVLRHKRFTPGVGGYLIFMLAGAYAAQIFRPDDYSQDFNQSYEIMYKAGILADFESVDNTVNLLNRLLDTDEKRITYHQKIQDRTEKIIKSDWCQDAIQAIAKALLEKKTLTGKEAKEIYYRAKTCNAAIL